MGSMTQLCYVTRIPEAQDRIVQGSTVW